MHPRYLPHSLALVARIYPIFPANAPALLELFGLKHILWICLAGALGSGDGSGCNSHSGPIKAMALLPGRVPC
jgi:hypothetical protein